MGANLGRKSTVTDGLVLCLDAGNPSSGNIIIPNSDLVNSGFSAASAPDNDAAWIYVEGGDTYFVAAAPQGGAANQFAYSKDGVSWTSASPSASNWWSNIGFGNGKFVITSGGSSNGIQYASESNISSWTGVTPPETNSWKGVAYGNGKFVTVAYNGTNRVMYASTISPLSFLNKSLSKLVRVLSCQSLIPSGDNSSARIKFCSES